MWHFTYKHNSLETLCIWDIIEIWMAIWWLKACLAGAGVERGKDSAEKFEWLLHLKWNHMLSPYFLKCLYETGTHSGDYQPFNNLY